MCSSWGEILEVNGIFCSPFVKIGALSSFLTFHRLVRSWEIWGQTLCVSKFLQIVLEAQVHFPLSPNPDRDSCRQCRSSSGFEGTTQRPPQQTARRLLHAWQRDQEGFPSAADQLRPLREDHDNVGFSARPGADTASLVQSLCPSGCERLPLRRSSPGLLWTRSRWFLLSARLYLTCSEHSVLSVAQPRSRAAPPHSPALKRNTSNDPAPWARVHLGQHYLPSSALSKKQLNCFQGCPLIFCSQAHTNAWQAASI